MYIRPYVSLIVVFQKKKTATNVYILKKITKIVKKKHSHLYALSAQNRIVIDRQALAKGRTGGEAIALLTLNQVKVM